MPQGAVRQLRERTVEALAVARRRPAFALYLAALALLPVKWLTPFSHQQAGWTDVFIAAAAAVWLLELLRGRTRFSLRPPHYAYAAYLAAGLLSALFASDHPSTAAE